MASFGMKPAFRQSLNCITYNYINSSEDAQHFSDISHASEYQDALQSMEDMFELAKERKKEFNDNSSDDFEAKLVVDERTIHIPLLFSMFYDGIQLYKSKVKSFSPLLLTILNLPPTLRKTMSFGKY